MTHPPRASLGRSSLPWASTTLRENVTAGPECAGLARGFACAKGVDASTSRGVATSATVRSRSASGRSAAGRRRGAKPHIASTPMSRLGTPRPKESAASVRSPRLRPLRTQSLRRRVVTQLRLFFSLPLCDRPGCYEHPANSPRNMARYCCPACRQAVRNVLDRERKWRSRGTLHGRQKRAIEYQAAQRRRAVGRSPVSNPSPSRPPPE